MAIIHGRSGSETTLLRKCNFNPINFNEIKPYLEKKEKELKQFKDSFYTHILPKRKKKLYEKIENLSIKKSDTEAGWDKKIGELKIKVSNTKEKLSIKKAYHLFPLLFYWSKLANIKYRLMPKELLDIQSEINTEVYYLDYLKNYPDIVFKDDSKVFYNSISHANSIIRSADYKGAYGELKFLEEMTKLSDEFHIISDVNINLYEYIRYKNTRNLKSAQMDFVIVSTKGVFVIEVKNWGKNYKHRGFSPYEQVDRAGLILYRHFKDVGINRKATKFLISIQQPFKYNNNYKSVLVNTHYGLKQYLEKRQNKIPLEEVDRIVRNLQKYLSPL
jgi:hypothetical protein